MATKPYYLVYALALGVGIPVLGFALKPAAPAQANPRVDAGILHNLGFGGNGAEVSDVAPTQDQSSASSNDVHGSAAGRAIQGELDELRGGAKRAALEPLPAINMDFGTNPAVQPRPLALSSDAGTAWAPPMDAPSAGGDSGLLAPPPIFSALAFGDFGGGGLGGGGSGTVVGGLTGGEYFLVGPPGGLFGGSGGEGDDNGSDGNADGGILHIGGGAAVPEPSSWMLGLCSAGVIIALRIRRRML